MSYVVRPWAPRDVPAVMGLIREAAKFHRALDQVRTTPEGLRQDGFGPHPKFGCLVAEAAAEQRPGDGQPILGYQFHYFTYCTWSGRILFGEDLFVRPEFRGKGIGTSLLRKVSQVARAQGCAQFRFLSAEWNGPATALYERLGAVEVTAKDGWNVWHIPGPALRALAPGARATGDGDPEKAGGENPGVPAPSPPPL